jgi:hypothetical protein
MRDLPVRANNVNYLHVDIVAAMLTGEETFCVRMYNVTA